jgi:hypothetical protein
MAGLGYSHESLRLLVTVGPVKKVSTGAPPGSAARRGFQRRSPFSEQKHEMAEEPPKEDFSVGPLSLLAESVKKNCQVDKI